MLGEWGGAGDSISSELAIEPAAELKGPRNTGECKSLAEMAIWEPTLDCLVIRQVACSRECLYLETVVWLLREIDYLHFILET